MRQERSKSSEESLSIAGILFRPLNSLGRGAAGGNTWSEEESGNERSTTGRLTIALIKPTSGSVILEGHDLWNLEREEVNYPRLKASELPAYATRLNSTHSEGRPPSARLFL